MFLLFSHKQLSPGRSFFLAPADILRPLVGKFKKSSIQTRRGGPSRDLARHLILLLFPLRLRNTTRTSAPRVHSCLAARSSALPSPGRSYATPRSCSWTRPPLLWTLRARRYASLNSEQRRHHLQNPRSSSDSSVQLLHILRAETKGAGV